MKKYKALIMDVDGTLMAHGTHDTMYGLPTKTVSEAIHKAKDKTHIALATARSLPFLYHLFDHLSLSGPSLVQGGSLIVDGKTRNILVEQLIEEEDFWEATQILTHMHIPFVIDETEKTQIPFDATYVFDRPLNIFVPDGLTQGQVEEVKKRLSHKSLVAVHQVPGWKTKNSWALNISHSQATKQYGILAIAQLLGIETRDIIGVGDGYNDFPLLMACGLKIAMGNAVPELKQIADYVAPPVSEDGIADIIDRFILAGV